MKRVILFTRDQGRAEAEIQRHSGRVTHRFGKDFIIARLPDGLDPGTLTESREVDAAALAAMNAAEQAFVQAFEEYEARRITAIVPHGDQLPWDAPGFEAPRTVPAPAGAPGTDGAAQTSGYLEGRVAVGIVVVSGPTKSLKFSQGDTITVMSQVIEGTDFLAGSEPTGRISFDLELQPVSISTPEDQGCTGSCDSSGYESCEAVWRNPAMAALGYAPNWSGVVAYVNDLKAQPGVSWAYAAYFTKYTLCWFAYASLGGPRLVMQYANDGWGPDNIHRVFAHESGHIFYAQDEYKESNCRCGSTSGYWNAPNNNCANCATDQVACLMNANTLSICFWSRRQLGWGGFGPQTKVTDQNGAKTSANPGLAAWGNGVTMAYRSSSNSDIWSCSFDGSKWGDQTKITDQNGAKTSAGPSLAAFQGNLVMTYRSSSNSDIWSCSFNGSTWGDQTKITDQNGAKTSATPAICAYRDKLYMFYRSSSNSDMWMCSFDGNKWGDQTKVTDKNGAKTGGAPALAVYQDKLWVAYVGEGGSKLYAFSYDGTTFSSQTNITDQNGAESTGGPALAAFNGFLYMLYQSSSNSDMWACAFDGTSWLAQWKVTDQNGAKTSAQPALAPLSSASTLLSAYRASSGSDIWSFQVYPDAPPPAVSPGPQRAESAAAVEHA